MVRAAIGQAAISYLVRDGRPRLVMPSAVGCLRELRKQLRGRSEVRNSQEPQGGKLRITTELTIGPDSGSD